jgi:hypothetical protein
MVGWKKVLPPTVLLRNCTPPERMGAFSCARSPEAVHSISSVMPSNF